MADTESHLASLYEQIILCRCCRHNTNTGRLSRDDFVGLLLKIRSQLE